MKNETEQNVIEKKPSQRKYITAAVCFVLFVVFALAVLSLNQEPKPDLESERIIRETAAKQLDKDPDNLTDEDFTLFRNARIITGDGPLILDWSYLEIYARELSDIKLISKFTNLEELGLSNIKYPKEKIQKWMKYFAKLGVIDLNKKFSIDLSPLKNLSSLKKLQLNNAQINDITPLKNLTNLEVLYIQNCPNITDEQAEKLQKALPNLKIIR